MSIDDVVRQYDIKHAVNAEIFVSAEHTTCEVHELVFGVCQQYLKELADTRPAKLTCWHDLCLRTVPEDPESRLWVTAYVVDHLNRVIHLGEIHSREPAYKRWRQCIEDCEEDNEHEALRKLRDEGPFQVLRDRYFGCTIGVEADTISDDVVKQGVRKFLRMFCPSLAELPIQWLPEEIIAALDKRIADFKEAFERCEDALFNALPSIGNREERLFMNLVAAGRRERDFSH